MAPYLLNGKKVGEIELEHGYFEFKNKTTQVVRDESFDGEKDETFNLPFTKQRQSKSTRTTK